MLARLQVMGERRATEDLVQEALLVGDHTFLTEPRKNGSEREVIVETVPCMSPSDLRCNYGPLAG